MRPFLEFLSLPLANIWIFFFILYRALCPNPLSPYIHPFHRCQIYVQHNWPIPTIAVIRTPLFLHIPHFTLPLLSGHDFLTSFPHHTYLSDATSSRSRFFVFCKAFCCPSILHLLLDLRLSEIPVEGERDRRGLQD